jgi:lycopene cyclase domain-containing protein
MTEQGMTYRGFHYRWTLPVLTALGVAWYQIDGDVLTVGILAALCVVVIGFTFPWDNWAVEQSIWDFPEGRLLFRIRSLPIEEIAFFVIQTLQVAFATAILCRLLPSQPLSPVSFTSEVGIRIGGTLGLWLLIGRMTRTWRAAHRSFRYAWHLGYWFLPIIVLQWLFGAGMLMPRLDVIIYATLIIGTYLSVADVWAVRHGIWFFDHAQTTGHRIATILPWEEVAFFYMTSLLVAQSTILLVPAAHP